MEAGKTARSTMQPPHFFLHFVASGKSKNTKGRLLPHFGPIVDNKPHPNFWSRTLTKGARQLVVHEALLMIFSSCL